MAANEIKSVSVLSLLKVLPLVFAIVGAVIGIFTFFIFPTDIASSLGFGQRILAWVIFTAFYTVIMVVGAVVLGYVYNLVVRWLGVAVSINIDKKEEF
jgi:hypothetical protein